MSLILDALRKAERERSLGHAPTLADLTQTPPKSAPVPREQHARALILAAIVILLLGLSLVLWIRPQPAPVAMTAPEDPGVEAEQRPLDLAMQSTADFDDPQAEGMSIDEVEETGPQSLDELLEPRKPASVEQRDSPQPEVFEAPEPYRIEIPADAPTLELPPEEPAVPVEAPAVRSLRDMPSSYRANFPDLRIEVHVHNEDPSKRWFLLGGTRFIEGSEMPEGPRVVEITAQGVVFDYRGETVLYSLER